MTMDISVIETQDRKGNPYFLDIASVAGHVFFFTVTNEHETFCLDVDLPLPLNTTLHSFLKRLS